MSHLVDSHCHIDFPIFDTDREEVLEQCVVKNIKRILIPGVEPKQWLRAQAVCSCSGICSYAAGLHPWWVKEYVKQYETVDRAIAALRDALKAEIGEPDCIAIGECGLDFRDTQCHGDKEKSLQIAFFEVHLTLACALNKPVIVHNVNAHGTLLTLLQKYQPPCGGVIHAFSGSREMAEAFWALKFRLGVGATISYPRASKTRAAIAAIPCEALLLETDAPDMPLAGKQGQRNSPVYIPEICQQLAALRGESAAHVAAVTSANYYALFGGD